jgi:hypothetical protein
VDQSPIEGFFIEFRPYSSSHSYDKQKILSPAETQYIISNLQADTEYSIRMQSFNIAGQSDNSNTVVKRTLGKLHSIVSA